MWNRYFSFCTKCELQVLPVTYRSLSVFLIDVVNSRGSSTKSLSGTVSQLRVSAGPTHWLNYDDELKLKYLVGQLKGLDVTDSNAVCALQYNMVAEAISLMDLSIPAQLQVATMLSTGVLSLFRTAETCSGILLRHVLFRGDGRTQSVVIKLLRTKTLLTGPGCTVEVAEFASPYCCYNLLSRWIQYRLLTSDPDGFLFPSLTDSSRPMSGDSFRKFIKQAASSIGLDPSRYSGHSLRSGGATDLFEARVPYHIIKTMGRWKSDAAMRYYRSDEDVVLAVKKAFTRMSKKLYRTPF